MSEDVGEQVKEQQQKYKNVDLIIELLIFGLMFISRLRKSK